MDINGFPSNLDEAIETMVGFYGEELVESVKTMDENTFSAQTHHYSGQFIRNTWCLWWTAEHNFDSWPKDKPGLVAYFHGIDITHADDMSGIIMTSTYRHIKGLPLDLEGQIKVYHDHWKQYGFPDGIPK